MSRKAKLSTDLASVDSPAITIIINLPWLSLRRRALGGIFDLPSGQEAGPGRRAFVRESWNDNISVEYS